MPRFLTPLLLIAWLVGGLAEAGAQDWQQSATDSTVLPTLQIENDTDLDLLRPESLDWLDWSEDVTADDSETEPPIADLRSVGPASGVANAGGTDIDVEKNPVRQIPTVVAMSRANTRMVRYEIPLGDIQTHQAFAQQGFEGQLVDIPIAAEYEEPSGMKRFGARLQRLFGKRSGPNKARMVRYDVPVDNLALHQEFSELDGEIIEPGILRLPEVRFFQPKARVFMDMKQKNDDEFDLFSDGAILASLDVVEFYFPMPLFSERFARAVGKTNRLSQLGWRVGGTVGLGITTALANGGESAGSAPITTVSTGLRYEFPLGRPPNEFITTGDPRFDQRTRVGIETGVQAGVSTNETLGDASDLGWYFGILVNTPWNSYGG